MTTSRSQHLHLEVSNIDVRGHVLARLAEEFTTLTRKPGTVSSHIKNNCDLHGKGSHIKGAGPNYLKTSDRLTLATDISDPAIERFIDAIATRVAARIR